MRCYIAWVETVFVHLSNVSVLPFPANNNLTGSIPSEVGLIKKLSGLIIGKSALNKDSSGECFF